MKYLLPAEKMLIRRDFLELIRGEQGANIIVHWLEITGDKDVYGKAENEVAYTKTIRGVVFPASQRADRMQGAERSKSVDKHFYDVTICFLPDEDLKDKKGIWFEVPGMANYVPDQKGLLNVTPAAPFFVEGKGMILEIACKVRT